MLTGILTVIGQCAAQPIYLSDQPGLILFREQGWGNLGLGTSAYAQGQEPMAMQIKDTKYPKGLGVHAPSQTVLSLGGRYLEFEAEVGVQKQQSSGGSVVFQVFVDDKKVFDSGVVTQNDAPKPVKVSLKGAEELRLVVTDAGDGYVCDCANWADARLVPDPNAGPARFVEGVDMAAFAKVVSWDPAQMEGSRAGRVEEFPAADLFPETEVVCDADGGCIVPDNGCIGLQWLEPRHVRALSIRFADPATAVSPEDVKLHYWATNIERGASSSSRWQGKWYPIDGQVTRDGDTLRVEIDWGNNPDKVHGTTKVRWVLPASAAQVKIRRLMAHTDSRWMTTEVNLQAENAKPGTKAKVTAYNALLLGGSGESVGVDWDLSKPLKLKVRHGIPKRWTFDRGCLRVTLPDGGFGIALDDLITSGCIYVRDFGLFASVEPAKETLEQHKKRIAGTKTILERVREMPDQTFDQAMKHVHRADGDLGPTLLSLACENHKYIHHRDGMIRFDLPDHPFIYINAYKPGQPSQLVSTLQPIFGSGNYESVSRKLEGGWLPIPVAEIREGGLVYGHRTFVAPFGKQPDVADGLKWLNDKPLLVSEYTVTNPGSKPADARVSVGVTFKEGCGEAPKLEVDGSVARFTSECKPFVWITSAWASPLQMTQADGQVVISGTLPAGASAKCVVYIPGWYAEQSEIAGITDTEPLHQRTVDYWNDVTSRQTRFEQPEEMLSNIIKASQVHILLAARSEEDTRVAAWIGAVHYGPLESEAHAVIRGMLFTGNNEYARRSLDFFISRYNPQGYLTTGYTVMGTGWHLWTLGEYYTLTRDKEWLERNASEIARVCRWVMAQREKTKKLDARGEKVPEWGLTPPGVCADWSVYSYYHYINGNFYAGLKSAGEALADIGHPDAEAILANAEELKECIMQAYGWAQSRGPVFPLKDGSWVPMYPTQLYSVWPTAQMYPSSDSGRSWCYDVEIGAHHLVPMGVMDPQSDQTRWMMDHMEDVQFLADGWFYYPAEGNEKDWFNLGGFAKVQPYYARTVEAHAFRDDVKPFIRSYFNSVISLLNREDLSLWEHFMNGAFNKTHETGYFLYETRMMFLTERGSELWIAPFVTSNWLKDGLTVGVKEALTNFGKVSYKITSHVKQGHIDAEIAVPTRQTPSEIVVRLRHPDGKKMRSVTVNGNPHTDFDVDSEIVRIKPDGGKLSVRADY